MPWVQRFLAAAAGALIGLAAWKNWWPFDAKTRDVGTYAHPSVWQFLLSDRYVLGAVRLGLAAFALYVAVSVLPLIAAARWVKGFGTSGVTADDALQASDTLEEYEEEVADLTTKLETATGTIDRVRNERDAAIRLVRAVTSPTTPTGPSAASPIVSEEGTTDDANRDQPEAGQAEPGGTAD